MVVDNRVHNHPRPASQLPKRGDVDEDRGVVHTQVIHDAGSKLQHLVIHVSHASREPTPIGQNEARESFLVEVVQCVGGLPRRVWEPHLASLRNERRRRRWVGRVSRIKFLCNARFDENYTTRSSSQRRSAHYDRLGPPAERLHPRSLIEHTGRLRGGIAAHQESRIVRLVATRDKGYVTVNRVENGEGKHARLARVKTGDFRNEVKPLEHHVNCRKVILCFPVSHTIWNHDCIAA
mmetsp:Transcript_67773/g.78737  ORF Transcript_67773/g.78737 Transcript_67773/m.78737 type:complete len:236 (-) Transcript_67773:76-783(-)